MLYGAYGREQRVRLGLNLLDWQQFIEDWRAKHGRGKRDSELENLFIQKTVRSLRIRLSKKQKEDIRDAEVIARLEEQYKRLRMLARHECAMSVIKGYDMVSWVKRWWANNKTKFIIGVDY